MFSLGSISFSVEACRLPACVGSVETIQGVKPTLPWILRSAFARSRACRATSMPLKAAWCSGVQPSLSRRSGLERPERRSGTISSRPFLAAMWSAECPCVFGVSILSFPVADALCWFFRMASTHSFRPQKTAAISAVQPFSSLWFTSARLASSSRTSLSVASGMCLTSSALAAAHSALSALGPWPLSSGAKKRRTTSALRLRMARSTGQSASLLWRMGSALALRSFCTRSAPAFSAAKSSRELPSLSA
mmetsp:Transcript_5940/g.17567  ORF Transcript_5940/g.17567 Transcript_5940/m.17567 type:complete len:248 (+) Transcript_5940:608-1351(+)